MIHEFYFEYNPINAKIPKPIATIAPCFAATLRKIASYTPTYLRRRWRA
eukprot:COSAG02_NODE_42750_length_381_cov_1.269504_1_plen_48_part_01